VNMWLYDSPASAGSHGWEAVEECAAGVLRSLGEGGHASARCRRRLKRGHGWEAVGLHNSRSQGSM